MKLDTLGKIYTSVMAVYFFVSGFTVLLDIEAKLSRIGLSATSKDGEIAFVLIYCGLMIGIGVAISVIAYFSKTWVYSAMLAVTIIFSFITFRLVGASMVGELSNVQISFIVVEIIEALVGLFLIVKSTVLRNSYA
ncbi:hypothetical protein GCM10008090_27810 [Arenicella chitinivorans]|uniref:DUF4345 domain-containing protein n=1 Tax=Arenicella chitinivorans TaxID=1329800 RepID=A0A918VRI5_9GAMM|nr:hypothetical protein [Arenicella chitinivorans]GHA16436.1 hypothetical protein GCM10008090_27810 [Arenicella chitinivorans]